MKRNKHLSHLHSNKPNIFSPNPGTIIRSIIARPETINKEIIEIRRVFVHPEFKFPGLYHDIAVAELGKIRLLLLKNFNERVFQTSVVCCKLSYGLQKRKMNRLIPIQTLILYLDRKGKRRTTLHTFA